MKPPARSNFSPAAVAEIRRQYWAGTLKPREWAQAYKVGSETIRRIARGDTYGNVEVEEGLPTFQVVPPPVAQAPGPIIPPTPDDPTAGLKPVDTKTILASLAKVRSMQGNDEGEPK